MTAPSLRCTSPDPDKTLTLTLTLTLPVTLPGNFFESRLQKKAAGVSSRDWLEYTNDAARLLYLEIDYDNEAKNSQLFASSLPKDVDVVVPRVYANATTARLLTMEYVD